MDIIPYSHTAAIGRGPIHPCCKSTTAAAAAGMDVISESNAAICRCGVIHTAGIGTAIRSMDIGSYGYAAACRSTVSACSKATVLGTDIIPISDTAILSFRTITAGSERTPHGRNIVTYSHR